MLWNIFCRVVSDVMIYEVRCLWIFQSRAQVLCLISTMYDLHAYALLQSLLASSYILVLWCSQLMNLICSVANAHYHFMLHEMYDFCWKLTRQWNEDRVSPQFRTAKPTPSMRLEYTAGMRLLYWNMSVSICII